MQTKYKKYINFIGNILVMISFLIIYNIIIDNYQKEFHLEFNFYTIFIIFCVLILNLFGYILFSYTWVIQLKEKYSVISFIISFYIISISQIGKYLPGNIGHFVGRFYLAKKFISKKDIIYTIFIENIMFVIISLLFGILYTYYIDISEYKYLMNKLYITISIIAIIFSIALFKEYLRNKINLLNINNLNLIKIFFIFFTMSLLAGLSIYILLNLIVENHNISYLQCIAGFALSFLIGYIVPGAPGGIGVREYSFVILFSPFIGEIYALEIILIFRGISILSDLLLFVIAKILSKNTRFKKIYHYA